MMPLTKDQVKIAFENFNRHVIEWPISVDIINQYIVKLQSEGYADTTIEKTMAYLKGAGKYMRGVYKLENPFEFMEKIKKEKKQRRYFTSNELMRILKAARYGYDGSLILTLIDSICRIGELGFEPEDPKRHPGLRGIDVGDGYINVRGKTGQRKYHLNKRVCNELKKLAGSDEGYVFKLENGNPVPTNTLKMRVRRIIARAGIKGVKVGPHTLRHSGASLVARLKQNPMLVQQLLQHDEITSSMKYVHDAVNVEDISILKMIRDDATESARESAVEVKQMGLGEKAEGGTALVPYRQAAYHEHIVEIKDRGALNEAAFPPLKVKKPIRPQLNPEDLKLIRDLGVLAFNTDVGKDLALKGRELLKRMLRQVQPGY